MAQCEMCGKEAKLITAEIEQVEMSVCSSCASFGKVKKAKPNFKQVRKSTSSKEHITEERVVTNAGKLIKQNRESMNMRQVDLAKMLQIKDSYLHHIETGNMRLPVHLAKKIEETLDITIVKSFKKERFEQSEEETDPQGMTIADFIKKR